MTTGGAKTQHIIIRIIAEDFDTWYAQHAGHAEARKPYGLTDGPVYRDITNPDAALVHLMTDDLPRAMEWFKTPEFREATARANVIGREIYVADRRQ